MWAIEKLLAIGYYPARSLEEQKVDKKAKKIFLICPVRIVTSLERLKISQYVAVLKIEGYEVYWPYHDTNQDDPVGTRICRDNAKAIFNADEVHVWFNPESTGSHFDLGMAFMLLCLGYKKKIVFANEKDVKIEKGKKSFPAVIRDLEKGNHPRLIG